MDTITRVEETSCLGAAVTAIIGLIVIFVAAPFIVYWMILAWVTINTGA